jgi:hypothetical protein
MKLNLKSVWLVAVCLLATPFAQAQLTLQNFSAFETTDTVFVGTWELNGDPIGTNSPRSTFSQGSGFYTFTGGTNADTSGVFYFFTAPRDVTGLTLLEVSAHLLLGNVAPTFTVSLFDSLGESASATFSAASFTGVGFSTAQTALTFSPGFDPTDLSSFQISGGVLGGAAAFMFAFDNLAVVAPRQIVAVPEPSTYGLAAAGVLLALAALRGPARSRALRRRLQAG